MLQLQLHRPDNAYDCALLKKSHAGNNNVTVFGGASRGRAARHGTLCENTLGKVESTD